MTNQCWLSAAFVFPFGAYQNREKRWTKVYTPSPSFSKLASNPLSAFKSLLITVLYTGREGSPRARTSANLFAALQAHSSNTLQSVHSVQTRFATL